MERMQPCVERSEADHEGDRIGADDARPRGFAVPSPPGGPHDRELERIDEGENRAEGEIDNDHRAQESADSGRADPNSQSDQASDPEQAKGEGFDLLSFPFVILRSLLGARVRAEQRSIPQPTDEREKGHSRKADEDGSKKKALKSRRKSAATANAPSSDNLSANRDASNAAGQDFRVCRCVSPCARIERFTSSAQTKAVANTMASGAVQASHRSQAWNFAPCREGKGPRRQRQIDRRKEMGAYAKEARRPKEPRIVWFDEAPVRGFMSELRGLRRDAAKLAALERAWIPSLAVCQVLAAQ